MGFWDDDTKDFSAFGIMANTPGPTPDAFLVKNVADQNTYNNPYNFGNSTPTYTPNYTPTSYDNDDRDYSYTPTRSQTQRSTVDYNKLEIRNKIFKLQKESDQLLREIAILERTIEQLKAKNIEVQEYEEKRKNMVKKWGELTLQTGRLRKQLY